MSFVPISYEWSDVEGIETVPEKIILMQLVIPKVTKKKKREEENILSKKLKMNLKCSLRPLKIQQGKWK